MSQPRDYGPNDVDPLAEPLRSIDQLLKIFHDAQRPKDACLLGLEYELFAQTTKPFKPLPYEGSTSISTFFTQLADRSKNGPDPFTPIMEGHHIVGLNCDRAVIALEPGGQLEIAAKPHADLFSVTSIFEALVREISDEAKNMDIKLFALGIHPMASREDMAKVKKARYGIMRSYMQGQMGLGLDMMTRSCAIQLNLDYSDESDCRDKMKLAAILVPFYTLLCASSAYVDQKQALHAIERGHVWRMTDAARTGIPAIIFEKNFGYEAWIKMALKVPMYFIRRGKIYEDVSGASFEHFMREGLKGHRAMVRDFVDHLSTIFTEVRLKPILEIRSPDSLPAPFVNALAALTWALFYDDALRQKTLDRFGAMSHDELVALHNDVIDHASSAKLWGQNIFDWADILLNDAQNVLELCHSAPPSSSRGLSAGSSVAGTSLDPADKPRDDNGGQKLSGSLLKPLMMIVQSRTTCAEWIRLKYPRLDEQNFKELVDNFAPLNNPL